MERIAELQGTPKLNQEDSIMNGFDFDILTAGESAQFGKHGSLRLRYLKENKPTQYQALLQGTCSTPT